MLSGALEMSSVIYHNFWKWRLKEDDGKLSINLLETINLLNNQKTSVLANLMHSIFKRNKYDANRV